MRRESLLLSGAVFGILVLVFSLAYAQHPRRDRGEVADELSLTDEQRDSIRDIQYDFRKAQIGLRAELKTSQLELRHLMMEENPNQGQISKLVDKIAVTQKELLKQRVNKRLAMKEILTPEQFKRFMKLRGERGEMRMGKGEAPRSRHPRGFRPKGEDPGF
jgi:Spy/CpxP family protein refolding chaperone